MISIKTDKEIELLRENALLVSRTLGELAKHIAPGVTTGKLDAIAEEFILDHQAKPGFKGYNGYPGTLCLSVNEQVVHGIPGNRVLESGDIISVDCGTIKHGYYGDSAYTFAVGEVSDEVLHLLEVTKQSLYKGIEMSIAGKRVGDVGHEIQKYVEQFGYTVVRDLVGHGIGKNMHEDPQVPNYGRKGIGAKLKNGMVFCIEPMINLGKRAVIQEADGWTIRTLDRKPSAHYELTVAVKNVFPDVLSTFDFIEEVLNSQNN